MTLKRQTPKSFISVRVRKCPAATSARYPLAGPLLADRWNEDLVAECYPTCCAWTGH